MEKYRTPVNNVALPFLHQTVISKVLSMRPVRIPQFPTPAIGHDFHKTCFRPCTCCVLNSLLSRCTLNLKLNRVKSS